MKFTSQLQVRITRAQPKTQLCVHRNRSFEHECNLGLTYHTIKTQAAVRDVSKCARAILIEKTIERILQNMSEQDRLAYQARVDQANQDAQASNRRRGAAQPSWASGQQQQQQQQQNRSLPGSVQSPVMARLLARAQSMAERLVRRRQQASSSTTTGASFAYSSRIGNQTWGSASGSSFSSGPLDPHRQAASMAASAQMLGSGAGASSAHGGQSSSSVSIAWPLQSFSSVSPDTNFLSVLRSAQQTSTSVNSSTASNAPASSSPHIGNTGNQGAAAALSPYANAAAAFMLSRSRSGLEASGVNNSTTSARGNAAAGPSNANNSSSSVSLLPRLQFSNPGAVTRYVGQQPPAGGSGMLISMGTNYVDLASSSTSRGAQNPAVFAGMMSSRHSVELGDTDDDSDEDEDEDEDEDDDDSENEEEDEEDEEEDEEEEELSEYYDGYII
jgi:hypothetical protein